MFNEYYSCISMETLPMYFSVDDVRDTIFSDFCHISQNQCYDKMFEKTSSILSKKTPIFSPNFWAKTF
jgi:hypothetical protein